MHLIEVLIIYSIGRAIYHYFVKPIVEHNRSQRLAFKRLVAFDENSKRFLSHFSIPAVPQNGTFHNGDHF